MNKAVIDSFWATRASEHNRRWTPRAMLEYETGWLSALVPFGASILDLGSGPGELSLGLLSTEKHLTLVEKQEAFLREVPQVPNVSCYCSDILDFHYPQNYDVILLFGVVTHLTSVEEGLVYEAVKSHLARNGVFIVKNQVSIAQEKIVNGFSEAFQQNYFGRYPAMDEQVDRLQQAGFQVEVLCYPSGMNPWPDTRHVAFICRH